MELNLTRIFMEEAQREGWSDRMMRVRIALLRTDVKRPATWLALERVANDRVCMEHLVKLLRVHCPVPSPKVAEEAGYLILAAYSRTVRPLGYVMDTLDAYIRRNDREGILFLCRMQAAVNAHGEYTHLNVLYNLLTDYLLRCRRERLRHYRTGGKPLFSEADLQEAEKYLPHLRECSFMDRVVLALPKVKSVEELARECGYTLNTFERRFKEENGETPGKWLTEQRKRRIRSLLTETDMPLQEIASACGFASGNYFWDFCKSHLGATPLQIREMVRFGE